MRFIKLTNYFKKSVLFVDANEIACLELSTHKYIGEEEVASTIIHLKNGKSFDVSEQIEDVLKYIRLV